MMTFEAAITMKDYDVYINSCNLLIQRHNFTIIDNKAVTAVGLSLRTASVCRNRKFETMRVTTRANQVDSLKLECSTEMKERNSIFILADKDATTRLNYVLSTDGSTKTTQSISAPTDYYFEKVFHIVWKDESYVFGGTLDYYKIAKLSCCEFSELSIRLTLAADNKSSGIVHKGDAGVLVCFSDDTKTCEFFDGASVSTFSAMTNANHKIKGSYILQFDLTWTNTAYQHPIARRSHTCMEVENGVLVLGGINSDGNELQRIDLLRNDAWTTVGSLQYRLDEGSRALSFGASIFAISGFKDSEVGTVEKLSWNGSVVTSSELIHSFSTSTWYSAPIVFKTNSDFCSSV
ncbi:Oidioi.mRNA.OKI2018_I69.chr2.g6451.t1.cds [Oikopleura dioica]|uniref:Oidioi.mRNA.OKI2018_I69.chr2.g6451.t1.cds n=1 Tax=Oikopleura dioica TaxID=34765 RepID=A0ABN7T7W0_OIKDI|nr:Oidioi.mRNA.OKI2018_I69.chr2.g6451.t1.cds [Oikopleura dioica]